MASGRFELDPSGLADRADGEARPRLGRRAHHARAPGAEARLGGPRRPATRFPPRPRSPPPRAAGTARSRRLAARRSPSTARSSSAPPARARPRRSSGRPRSRVGRAGGRRARRRAARRRRRRGSGPRPGAARTVASRPSARAGSNSDIEREGERVGPDVALPRAGTARRCRSARARGSTGSSSCAARRQLVDARAGGRRRACRGARAPTSSSSRRRCESTSGLTCGQAGAQVGEALGAEQQLAHDEQRPALADEVERACDPAAIAVGPPRRHSRTSYRVVLTSVYLIGFSN